MLRAVGAALSGQAIGIRSILKFFWHTTITATEVVNRVVNSVGRLFGYERGTKPATRAVWL